MATGAFLSLVTLQHAVSYWGQMSCFLMTWWDTCHAWWHHSSILLGTTVLLSDDMVRHLPCLVTSRQYPTGDNCPAFWWHGETLAMLGDITAVSYWGQLSCFVMTWWDTCHAWRHHSSILLGTTVLLCDDMVRHLPCLVTSQQHPTVPLCDDTMILCETLVMLGDIYSSILLGTTVPLCDGTGYRETLVMLGDIESSIPSWTFIMPGDFLAVRM